MSRILKAASNIAMVTLVSRVLGLCRDVIMTHVFGATWVMGTFVVAWMIPNMLRRLFGEGALSAALIPVYTQALERRGGDAEASEEPADPTVARRLLGAVTSLLLTALGLIVVLGVVFVLAAPADWFVASDPQRGDLLLRLTGILFPYCLPICLAAILAGALNCHRHFALPAAAPIILNLVWIAGALIATTISKDLATIATVVATSLLIAGLLQLLMMAWQLRRIGESPILTSPGQALAIDGTRRVLATMAPAVLGMSLVQINALVDQLLAYYLVGHGAPSYLYMANRLLLFPHALTSLALATAAFPSLAAHAARAELTELRDKLDATVLQTLWLALPASLGMMLVAEPLIVLMFEHGEFGSDDTQIAARTTICLVASLPALGSAQLHARALHAMNDTRTPAIISGVLLLLNVGLNLLFVLALDLGTAGLAMATTLCAVANHFLLRQRLLRRCPETGSPRRSLLPVLAATGAMGVAVWSASRWLESDRLSRINLAIYDLGLPICIGVASYCLVFRMLAGSWRAR